MKAAIVSYRDIACIEPGREGHDRFWQVLKDLPVPCLALLDVRGMTGAEAFDAVAYAERHLRTIGLPTNMLRQMRDVPSPVSLCGGNGFSPPDCIILRRRTKPTPCELIDALVGALQAKYAG